MSISKSGGTGLHLSRDASGIQIMLGNHAANWVATHHFCSTGMKKKTEEEEEKDEEEEAEAKEAAAPKEEEYDDDEEERGRRAI